MRDPLCFFLLPLLFLPLMSYAQGEATVNGSRSMVNGSMVNGQCSMVNGQWSMVNGSMWDALASSPYRLDTADVRALNVELESISFFRDNEFNSPLADGYSLPGLWVQPKLTYMPLKQIKLELGLQALIFNGANRYPNYVYHDIGYWKGSQYTKGAHLLPWFRAQADFRHLTIVLGNIYGGQNHGLIEPLFNPEASLGQTPSPRRCLAQLAELHLPRGHPSGSLYRRCGLASPLQQARVATALVSARPSGSTA